MSNADQPAFPCSHPKSDPCSLSWIGGGLTKREQLAAMAMQGLLAASGDAQGNVDCDDATLVKSAVDVADALLAELAKGKP